MPAPICFLSDFGLDDSYVGVVKGAILSVDSTLQVVDLTHAVPPQDVRSGAFLLMTAVPYFPPGTVYLAVVDPGVGTDRRAIAVEAAGYRFIGPDNGLLSWALLRLSGVGASVGLIGNTLRLGGGVSGVALTEPRFWRPTVSATFHGRDVFGPVAAHLAGGLPLAELGPAVESIRALPLPGPSRQGRTVRGEVIHVDRYGNLVTNLSGADVPPDATIGIGDRAIVGLAPHFQQPAELIALVGSSGLVEIAVPNGDAARRLGLGAGATVTVTSSTNRA